MSFHHITLLSDLLHRSEELLDSTSADNHKIWSDIIDQIVSEYLGMNHNAVHEFMVDSIPHLCYKTILVLFGQVHAPLKYTTLEFHIHELANILKHTNFHFTPKKVGN